MELPPREKPEEITETDALPPVAELEAMTDGGYAALDLTPDFDAEDNEGV